jgi:broad specificity phosphatase PhoE
VAALLVLIRHAHIDCSADGFALLCGSHDAELSSTGRKQVEQLRAQLEFEPPASALYSSHLLRAVQTAQAAPASLLRGMRKLKSLAEIHCGTVEGLAIEHVRAQYPGLWTKNLLQEDAEFRWPGGESYRQFRRRVLRIISAIANCHPHQRVMIFTHAGVVNQIAGSIWGQSAARWEHPRPRNCGITEVLWGDHIRRLERLDDAIES